MSYLEKPSSREQETAYHCFVDFRFWPSLVSCSDDALSHNVSGRSDSSIEILEYHAKAVNEEL
jgi:hypothetical protein